jgi:Family of unknown function (DUF5906)/RepB DNA-primase from phage plasmid
MNATTNTHFEVQNFIVTLTGSADTHLRWRAIDPKGNANVKKLGGAFGDVSETLQRLNDGGYGIFAGVNPGGDSDEDITECNAVFVDIDAKDYDDKTTGKGGGAKAAEIVTLLGRKLPPSMGVQTSKRGVHLYWKLAAPISCEEFTSIQKALALTYNTDPVVVNPSRIMRVPGFKNTKPVADGFVAKLIVVSDTPRYTVEQIREALLLGVSTPAPATRPTSHPNTDLMGLPPAAHSIKKLAAMGAFVNQKSATTFFASLGDSKAGYALWRDSVLMPLKSEATKRADDARAVRGIFDSVSKSFGDNSDVARNDDLWHTTKASEITIGTFIAIAQRAGYIDTVEIESSASDLLSEFNERFSFVNMQGKPAIISERLDIARGFARLEYSTTKDFRDLHPEQIPILGKDGKQRMVAKGKYWLEHPNRKKYNSIVFLPMQETPADAFNVWRGFPFEPKRGDCSKFLRHVREIICNDEPTTHAAVEQWLAHIFQRPSEKPGFLLALIGKEGAGKGIFVHGVGSLLGSHYCAQLDAKALTGQFNSELAESILAFADEVRLTGHTDGSERFKRLITEPVMRIEHKGINAVEIASYHRFILSTNFDHALNAGKDARRFLPMRVSDAKLGDGRYFDAIKHELDNGGREALLHHFLHEVDISGFNRFKPPETAELWAQKIESLPPLERWFYDQLLSGQLWEQETRPRIQPSQLAYQIFDTVGVRVRAEAVGKSIRNLFGVDRTIQTTGFGNGDRQRVYELPTLSEARAKFSDATGIRSQWVG